ncbi:MAG: HD domain-containing protein [Candidatus Absconditabacteria bacterium]|nr:HD domain-containing protein [Candidatus Absconditabacteria bacterium]
MNERIEKIKELVKKELQFCSAHNFDHVTRVYNLALLLAKDEDVDLDVIKAAALLHDIGGKKEVDDPTGKTDHAIESAKMAEPILEELNYTKDQIKHIQNCIISHRYRTDNKPETLEAKIVFDADKLETVGAIGIARAFVWVGRNNAHIFRKVNIDEYAKENLGGKINGRIQDKTKHSPQINWETKDKYILDYLHTDKAKEIAKERIKFYKDFFERLENEIDGKM